VSIQLVLDPASVTKTTEYVAQEQESILLAVRAGMQEAMQRLAWQVIDRMQGEPITSRSGALLGAILDSPKVTETAETIRGTVSSDVGAKHVGLWLEEGTHVPEVQNSLFEFTEPDAQTLYTRGHRAFDVKPHPFLNPTLREYETTITQIITDAVDAAMNEAAAA
jgi:hypothetical protein